MQVKHLVIGAGISGLTFANYCGEDYLIVEKENEAGVTLARCEALILIYTNIKVYILIIVIGRN